MYKEVATKIKLWFHDNDWLQERNGVISFTSWTRHEYPEYKIWPPHPTNMVTVSGEIELGDVKTITEKAAYGGCAGYEFVVKGTRDVAGEVLEQW